MNRFFRFSTILVLFFALLLSACGGRSPAINGEWELVSYGDPANPSPALADVATTVKFGDQGQFGGTLGCNTFNGHYKTSGSQITFGVIMSTLMYCEGSSDQETAVLQILGDKTFDSELNGDLLTLTTKDKTTMVVFKKKQ